MVIRDSAEQYGVGIECTWHGPLTFAALPADPPGADPLDDDPSRYRCPSCGGPLTVVTCEQFWQSVAVADTQRPGYENIMCWSEGKCYPDFDTMENAWRQALEQ